MSSINRKFQYGNKKSLSEEWILWRSRARLSLFKGRVSCSFHVNWNILWGNRIDSRSRGLRKMRIGYSRSNERNVRALSLAIQVLPGVFLRVSASCFWQPKHGDFQLLWTRVSSKERGSTAVTKRLWWLCLVRGRFLYVLVASLARKLFVNPEFLGCILRKRGILEGYLGTISFQTYIKKILNQTTTKKIKAKLKWAPR